MGVGGSLAIALSNPDTQLWGLMAAPQNFHAAILDAARNRFLLQAVKSVQKTLLILGRSTMEQADRAAHAITEHDAILAALNARDEDGAERAMRDHIQRAHAARLRQIRDARPLEPGAHDL